MQTAIFYSVMPGVHRMAKHTLKILHGTILLILDIMGLKVMFAAVTLVCFLTLNESTCQTRKNVFISLQKLFSFSRKSNFVILHFQISWRHQMPKHKTRNTFH